MIVNIKLSPVILIIMKKSIPLFPLNLVPFPGEDLNLHIFEDRYRQLITDCNDKNLTFGVIPLKDGELERIGTEFKLSEISQTYDDGRMDIKTKGLQAFELFDYKPKLEQKLYPGGRVEMLEDDITTDFSLKLKVVKLREELYKIMKLDPKLKISIDNLMSYDIAHKLGLNFDQELDLLSIRSEKKRLVYLYNHLQSILPSLIELEEMKRKVKLNGHFKKVQ